MRNIRYIFFHCTAGPQDQKVENIQGYWRSIGWKTDGYHHLIDAKGKDHNLVPIEKMSNGVSGYNDASIHISYIGGVEVKKGVNDKGKPINVIGASVDNRTPEQIETMITLLKKYKKMFPKAKVLGHRDISPDRNRNGIIEPNEWTKTCPSFSVAHWLKCTGLDKL